MNYAKKIKVERTRQNLSLRALAEISGVPFQDISRIENGKNRPCFDTMVKLSEALCISLDYLGK
jgi:transcriptional regulator with XRE-family HTH domain